MIHRILYAQTAAMALALACAFAAAAERTQSFDTDPGWQAVNNRIVPDKRPHITQNFGYSKEKRAIGGEITRASEPAFYGDNIGSKTLHDKLTASGSFIFTKTTAGSGMFFGFFRAQQPGAGGRPVCSLGMDFDGEHTGARLAVRLITARNQSCGTFITPFTPGKFRPTPIRNDGTRYPWSLDYDPQAAAGRGQFTFTLQGDAGEFDVPDVHRKEADARFPRTTTFTVTLPEGFKDQGTTFDHFGMMNMMKPGGTMAFFCDKLTFLDRVANFSVDPNWDASGNARSYDAVDVGGAHNFGFSDTNFAGGKRGELGGTFWRAEKPVGCYADAVGPLSLADKLVARGKVAFLSGGPDSDMWIGFFNSKTFDHQDPLKDFVGVHVGGPTRVGHYFAPYVATSAGIVGKLDEDAPVIVPDARPRHWSLEYDPNGRSVTVRLDEESATLKLKPFKGDATLDRFGVFTVATGGQMVKIYLDDITYTAAR